MYVTRRAVLAGFACASSVSPISSGLAAARSETAVRFVSRATRNLPPRFCGFNTPVMWDIPFEDPALRPILAGIHPALLRFPGGSIANHWSWKSGRVEVGPGLIGNFVNGARNAPSLHPQGATYEDFVTFAHAVGSEVILVLNLQTASLEDQMDWLRHLVQVGTPPTLIELGNEFYNENLFARRAGTSVSIASEDAALRLSERFATEARKIVPDAKIAVQSAGSAYNAATGINASPLQTYLDGWDAGLVTASWYDAVTWHIYPEITTVMGVSTGDPFAAKSVRTPALERFQSAAYLDEHDAELAFTAMLARIESGTRRHVQWLAHAVPGKAVWVTEWGTGENHAYYRGERPKVTGLWIHALARQLMCLLRESSVMIALNHGLYVDGLAWSCIRRDDSESGYRPVGAYDVLGWLYEAANAGKEGAGVQVIDYALEGARSVRGAGPGEELYIDLLALEFIEGGRRTLIAHNTRATAVRFDLGGIGMRGERVAEALETPSLLETYGAHKPAIRPLAISGDTLTAPPRSLIRVRQKT